MTWLFLFFFVSGFCSILYEIIWLRLAMAEFGVTSALVSIVLSVFMAGLGLGAWGSGHLIRRYGERFGRSALRLYAVTELLIGVSAILVPYQLVLGRSLLERLGFSSSWSYYLASGTWVGLTLIPWCACMGATIPVVMLAIRNGYFRKTRRSFSYLYVANVLGATMGTVLPLLLIELYGFRGTLRIGAVLNVLLAATAIAVAHRWPAEENAPARESSYLAAPRRETTPNRSVLALLFIGGLTSMGAEVVWIRQFTPYLGTMVYAFASILGVYLISTFFGSWLYRRWSSSDGREDGMLWVLIGLAALLPLVTADPSLGLWQGIHKLRLFMGLVRVLLGVAPFPALLGFVTPMLVDRWSDGNPDKAGSAYAVNVVGCILGPLLSGFVLLPFINERWVLFMFALPWLAVGFNPGWWTGRSAERPGGGWRLGAPYAVAGLALVLVLITKSYETQFSKRAILRDNTATTVAVGEGWHRQLLVNGRGMTGLTPITKMMAHLPLASLNHSPHRALVVCFGMGTTYRALLSWGIETTAVELVPGVPRLFWYYHDDAARLLSSPLSHVEIDDGRRYLERTPQQYDVITIDPPPPVESAGSSLLYSKEFYSTIKQRLVPGGILQQWLPAGDDEVQAAVARALQESFPYVRVFHSVKGWGMHFIASDTPLPRRSSEELVQRMPAAAVQDMMEWGPYPTPSRQFSAMLDSELPLEQLLAASPRTVAMQDDRPVNEYFLLRLLKKALRPRGSVPARTAKLNELSPR
jgi:spermidine synthase